MCGRYLMDEDSEELRLLVERMNQAPLLKRITGIYQRAATTAGEAAPTDIVPAVATSRSGQPDVFPMRWGYTLPKSGGRGTAGLLINARSETADQKPLFRESWQTHRCAIPASAYLEWTRLTDANGRQRTGSKYRIQPCRGGLTWLAGLYRLEQGMPVFVILTRAPSPEVAAVHDRMPLILPREAVKRWIDPAEKPDALLNMALLDMAFIPAGPERISIHEKA